MEPGYCRGPCAPAETVEATSVWPSKLPDAAQAGLAMRLARALKVDMFSIHQKFGRATIRGEVSYDVSLLLVATG
jgi:hypothetical protein